MRNIKTITLRLSDDLHKKLKLYAVKEETTMQDFIISLVEENLKKSESKKQS